MLLESFDWPRAFERRNSAMNIAFNFDEAFMCAKENTEVYQKKNVMRVSWNNVPLCRMGFRNKSIE